MNGPRPNNQAIDPDIQQSQNEFATILIDGRCPVNPCTANDISQLFNGGGIVNIRGSLLVNSLDRYKVT